MEKNEMERKIALSKMILDENPTLRRFYSDEYGIRPESFGKDLIDSYGSHYLDIIINDGLVNQVFTEDEVDKVLYPERHEKRTFEMQGYEHVDVLVDETGYMIEDIESSSVFKIPSRWKGHSFKIIRVSEHPSL